MTRPFRVLGVQQIAVGSTDKSRLRRLWIDTLGLEDHGSYRSEKENVDEDMAAIGHGPLAVHVDLMQPVDPEKRPKVHEPPKKSRNRLRSASSATGVTLRPKLSIS